MSDIRNANLQDVPEITPFIDAFASYAEAFTDLVDKEYTIGILTKIIKEDICLVAENTDGNIIGVIGGLIAPFCYNPAVKTAVEMFWWVDPQYRQINVGEDLLHSFEDAAWLAECELVTMSCLAHTHPAVVKSLENNGYFQYESAYLKRID